jgi:hypothetical protein
MKQLVLTSIICLFSFFAFAKAIPQDYYGHWLQKKYAESLKNPHTANSNALEMEYITEFIFSAELGNQVMVAFNDTEGSTYPIEAASGKIYVQINENEIYNLSVFKEDGVKKMVCRNDDGQKMDFIFIEGEELEFNSAKKWMNQEVFAGNYSPIPANGMRTIEGEGVWMNGDGTLKGVDKFDRYEIQAQSLDLAEFPLIKLINSTNGKSALFAYETIKNKITLYQLKKNKDANAYYVYDRGGLYLQLEKKK